jgi:colicin import membrane protein
MKKLFILLACIWLTVAGAQAPNASMDDSDFERVNGSQRSRIHIERDEVKLVFEGAEALCYQRFAVNDCLRKARVVRREALADLRRQEVSLNAQEAKRKAAIQVSRIEEKSSLQSLNDELVRLEEAQLQMQERERLFNSKAADRVLLEDQAEARQAEAKARMQKAVQAQQDRAAKAAAAAVEKEIYDKKQLDAQLREAQRQKRLADVKRPEPAPLPLPP